MDITYDLFHRLMINWQRSIETREANADPDALSCGPGQHARRLIAQCGLSSPNGTLVLEED